VVDTGIGTNYDRLLAALDEVGIGREDLEVIAPTHVHLDHAGGAGFLARDYPNADVYVHEVGARHLVDPERLVEGTKRAVGAQWERFYVEPEPVPAERMVELSDGDGIDLGDRRLEVHHAPGHAPHQVVFFEPASGVLFSADAAGIYVPARDAVRQTTPPPNFDLEQALDDVAMQRELAPEVVCYPHFGPGDGDADDLLAEYAAVLPEWVAAVEEQYERLGDEEQVVAYFVEHEDVSDLWGEFKARGETAMNVRGVLRYLKQQA
jgi:glyoxylase-like metal-dependent hydrolase (beta-lactamase superfamily II)